MENLIEKFIQNPKNLDLGAGKLAERWGVTKEEIYAARIIARERLAELAEDITDNKYLGSETSDSTVKKTFHTPKPLTVTEINTLVGIDGVTSKISKVTDRLLPNGTWVYTIEIKCDDDFYSASELQERLKSIFPKIKPVKISRPIRQPKERMLMIVVSDDHAGAVNDYSIFGNEWSAEKYKERLLETVETAREFGVFEEVNVLSLGDQMNGWNAQTTRGGHEVKSLSNKEQFDIYTESRVAFYDSLFSSGLGQKYNVLDVENSNHTGNHFSYMANKFLNLYLSSKYPTVSQKSYFMPIDYITYGIHTIGFTHGKDEGFMTKPLPFKLDQRTDLFLYQYFDTKGISPSKGNITVYKGDLHSYAVEKGRFGRYINVPSIMGSTTWSEVNFGNASAGTLLEIYEKNNPKIIHCPVSF